MTRIRDRKKETLRMREYRKRTNRATDRAYYERNKERIREWHKAYAKRNHEKIAARARRNYGIEKRLYRYHLTLDQYHAMLESQGELCKICKAVLGPTSNKTHIDHDPKLGLTHVRGLLCGSCNKGLGYFKDRPELMRAAAAYVEEA